MQLIIGALLVLVYSLAVPIFPAAAQQSKTAGKGSFSFVVWGHPRGGDSLQPPLYFEEILQTIAELDADLLIITGDTIDGMWGAAPDPAVILHDWEYFDAGVGRLGIPVYRLPGNHDVHNSVTLDIYLKRYPALPYAFSFGSCRFLMLDTIGIDQQADNPKQVWGGGSLPFSEEQRAFIHSELGQQERYDHVFLFTHHSQPWSEPDGYWWKDVHPDLVGGRTRAVFAGNPWEFKYAHLERDGIHYIQSACLGLPDASYLKEFAKPEEWAVYKQLDNLQYVRVDGAGFTVRTIPIGALESEALNWSFWDQIAKPLPTWSRNFMVRFHIKISRLRDLLALAIVWGAGFFIIGSGATFLWIRHRRRNR